LETSPLDQFPYRTVAEWLVRGEMVPFLGAGASRVGITTEMCPPDGRGLAQELATEMPSFPGDPTSDLAKVAQYYEHTAFDRPTLYNLLRKRFEELLEASDPSQVAQTLAAMPWKEKPLFLITTNYDSFIERAFRDAGRPICVITQNMRDPNSGATAIDLVLPDGSQDQEESAQFQWAGDERFPSGCAYLFKMHGSVHRPLPKGPDDVIITEDDYVDFMVNSGTRLSPFFPPAALTKAYKQRHFLFLGYSLYDWNFRAFLRMLTLRNALSGEERKLRHFAVQKAPDPLEVKLWEQRYVSVFDGELDAFCDTLTTTFGAMAS
jgi:hypothetical protein